MFQNRYLQHIDIHTITILPSYRSTKIILFNPFWIFQEAKHFSIDYYIYVLTMYSVNLETIATFKIILWNILEVKFSRPLCRAEGVGVAKHVKKLAFLLQLHNDLIVT